MLLLIFSSLTDYNLTGASSSSTILQNDHKVESLRFWNGFNIKTFMKVRFQAVVLDRFHFSAVYQMNWAWFDVSQGNNFQQFLQLADVKLIFVLLERLLCELKKWSYLLH